MHRNRLSRRATLAFGLAAGVAAFAAGAYAADVSILNVSYDPARELYQEFNVAFAKHWKAETGDNVTIKQSHRDVDPLDVSQRANLQRPVVARRLPAHLRTLLPTCGRSATSRACRSRLWRVSPASAARCSDRLKQARAFRQSS